MFCLTQNHLTATEEEKNSFFRYKTNIHSVYTLDSVKSLLSTSFVVEVDKEERVTFKNDFFVSTENFYCLLQIKFSQNDDTRDFHAHLEKCPMVRNHTHIELNYNVIFRFKNKILSRKL
jgi:hypothetical protein